MKPKKKLLGIIVLMAAGGALLFADACRKSDKEASQAGQAVAADVQLCTACGQIKESELCCKPDAAKCTSCSLAKGSPGCCNIPPGAKTAAICGKCGQIKGSELCCKPNQTLCPNCGLVKGSPGCCKLPKS